MGKEDKINNLMKYYSRLIDGNTNIDIKERCLWDKDLEKFLNKATIMGLKIREFETFCNNYYYIVETSLNNNIIYIPDAVEQLEQGYITDSNGWRDRGNYADPIRRLRGNVIVQGGKNLSNLDLAFSSCKLDILDLRKLQTENLISMKNTFQDSCIGEILFGGSFDTSRVRYFSKAFYRAGIEKLDLTTWDTGSAREVSMMFWGLVCVNFKLCKINIDKIKVDDLDIIFNGIDVEHITYNGWKQEYINKIQQLNVYGDTFEEDI